MYFLLIEIAGYRQLLRVNRDRLVRLVQDICSTLEHSGGTVQIEENGLVYAEFRSSSSFDLGRIVHGAYTVHELLRDSRQDLHGFSMVMEYLRGTERSEAHRRLNVLLQNAAVESCFWIGANASASVMPFLNLQRKLDMWRVDGIHDSAVVLPDFSGFIRNTNLVEPLFQQISTFLNEKDADRNDAASVVLVHGVPGSGVFAVVREIASLMSPDDRRWPVPECIAYGTDDNDWSAFQSLGGHSFFSEVAAHLSAYEAEIWQQVRWALSSPYDTAPGAVHPDSMSYETEHALSLFLKAYVTEHVGRDAVPVLILQRIEQFPSDYLSIIQRAISATSELGGLCVIASAYTPHIPAALRCFRSRKLATRALDPAAISEFLGSLPPHLHRDASSRVRVLTRGRALQLYQYLWMIERMGPGIEQLEQRDKDMDAIILSVLNDHEKAALCVAAFAAACTTASERIEFLTRYNVPPTLSRDIWKSLSAAGLVYRPDSPFPTSDRLVEKILELPGTRVSDIRLLVQNELYRLLATGQIGMNRSRYRILRNHPESDVRLHVLDSYLKHELYSGNVEILDAVLSGDLGLPAMNDNAVLQRQVERTLYLLRLARSRDFPTSADTVERPDMAPGDISAWTHYFSTSETDHDGRLLLERSRWHYSVGAIQDSSRFARRAAVRFQETGDESGAAEAQVEIGAAQLASGNVTEAREYFAMARTVSADQLDVIHRIRSLCMEAVATFLYGNYTYCFELCDHAETAASAAGSRSWELFAGFVRGRAHMELGRYAKGAELFDQGIRKSSVYGLDEAQSTFILWYARACAYDGSPDVCLQTLSSAPDTAESRLFAAEALDISDRADDALERLQAELLYPATKHAPVIRPCWTSGFAGIEDLVHRPANSILKQLVESFTGYLLGRTGETEHAIAVLRECTRTVKSAANDPHAPLYYFWYSSVLPHQKTSRYDDPSTEIGRSVKIVQQRLSRIEQHTHKLDYRNRNRWYHRLFDEARKHNLV